MDNPFVYPLHLPLSNNNATHPMKTQTPHFQPVTITGPKELVAILANAINDEVKGANDPVKVDVMRKGMLSALSLCTVTVRNDTNAGDRWA